MRRRTTCLSVGHLRPSVLWGWAMVVNEEVDLGCGDRNHQLYARKKILQGKIIFLQKKTNLWKNRLRFTKLSNSSLVLDLLKHVYWGKQQATKKKRLKLRKSCNSATCNPCAHLCAMNCCSRRLICACKSAWRASWTACCSAICSSHRFMHF